MLGQASRPMTTMMLSRLGPIRATTVMMIISRGKLITMSVRRMMRESTMPPK